MKPAVYIVKGLNTLEGVLFDELKKSEKRYSNEASTEKQIRKSIRKDYEVISYDNFIKSFSQNSSHIIETYSNRIIVFDEAHKLVTKENAGTSEHYGEIHRFLHSIHSSFILLLTATPVRDVITEFPKLINLILPLDKQLPTEEEFLEQFIDWSDQNSINLNDKTFKSGIVNKKKLEPYLRGRILYLKAASSQIKAKDIENVLYKPFIPLDSKHYQLEMSDFQWRVYQKATEKDGNKILFDDIENIDDRKQNDIHKYFSHSGTYFDA
jgi:hypothetical protein